MKLQKIIIILFIFTRISSTFGQIIENQRNEKPYIEVIGESKQEVIPDEIYVAFTINERLEGKNKATIEKQETDLKEELKKIGVTLDNLTFLDINTDYIKIKWKKDLIVSEKNYMLKVKSVENLKDIFNIFNELKIYNAHITKLKYSRINDLKKELRIKAIKNAKEKADYILSAIGEETGKPLKIYEIKDNYSEEKIRGYNNEKMFYVDGVKIKKQKNNGIIQFQKIKYGIKIYVKFEIK